MNQWLVLGGAVVLSLGAGGYFGYQYRDGQAAKAVVKELSAEEKRRLAAYDSLTRANAILGRAADDAVAELERVRQEKPKTLVKTVVKIVEVPSGATSVECADSVIGDDFVRLWNDAAGAYNALPRAD